MTVALTSTNYLRDCTETQFTNSNSFLSDSTHTWQTCTICDTRVTHLSQQRKTHVTEGPPQLTPYSFKEKQLIYATYIDETFHHSSEK